MSKTFLILTFIFLSVKIYSQNTFFCVVKDSASNEIIPGVRVFLKATTNGVSTNSLGKAELKNIPNGTQTIVFTFIGYKTISEEFLFPLSVSTKVFEFFLIPENESLEEIIVSTTRTNSRIDDLNTKVEVLGEEDMDEESTVVPGSVASILGDLSIITIQRMNPINGNDAIRMQGLDARYTQIMRDGLPLYGGFSGSLGVLSIPPLDLKQVEIIKGSASTLYGGGAIGGLINFISKTPADSTQATAILNGSRLGEGNINAFVSGKKNKVGATLFTGANIKQAVDINKDGFAEVPSDQNY